MSAAADARLAAGLPAYQIEGELGGGGMSRVLLATERALHRRVVIKLIGAPDLAVNVERFRREILLSASLQHPHIVPVLTAGQVEGTPFFVMPFVEGQTLRARLLEGGPLPQLEAARLLRNVASALAYAHREGVVHRDVKPENVMISGGVAVVLDFGVSKALAASRHAAAGTATAEGVVIGTPAYMAPEQVAGDADVDQRADVYGFGVLAYEMFAGARPFAGRTPAELLRAQLVEPAPPIRRARPDLDPRLAALIMHCLRKDPAARPNMAELLRFFDSWLTPSGAHRASGRSSLAALRGALDVLAPTALYLAACAAAVLGLRWLAAHGAVQGRLAVLGVIGSLTGLPIIVAGAIAARLHRLERRLG